MTDLSPLPCSDAPTDLVLYAGAAACAAYAGVLAAVDGRAQADGVIAAGFDARRTRAQLALCR